MLRFLLFAMGLMFLCLALLGAGYLLLPQDRHNLMEQATLQPPSAPSTPINTPKPILYATTTTTFTPTRTFTPAACTSPTGWKPYVVKPGDTLFSLASANGMTVEEFARANCLFNNVIYLGQVLAIPPAVQNDTPTVSPTPPSLVTLTSVPASTVTPAPGLAYLFEAEWPARMEIGHSAILRVSLIRANNGYVPTVEIGDRTVVVSTPIVIGTPGQDLPFAYGSEYKAYATVQFVGVNFARDPMSFPPQSLDQPRIDWIWSISSEKLGFQHISVLVQIEWRDVDNPTVIQTGQVWHSPDIEIEVYQPFITTGQISILSLISGFLGSGLSFPWLYGLFRPSKKVVPRKVKSPKNR